jgi:peptidoglycan/LPS O-acetylase OafA/YrhL
VEEHSYLYLALVTLAARRVAAPVAGALGILLGALVFYCYEDPMRRWTSRSPSPSARKAGPDGPKNAVFALIM